jgi:hypothetical protein
MRPNYNKSTGQTYSAAEWGQLKSKCNAPGLNNLFTTVVSFDDEYYPDKYTMSGALTYTINATNAATGNGRKDTIVGDGNTITFTEPNLPTNEGFTIRQSDLTPTSNVVTTVSGNIYTIVFLRVGSVSEVYLTDTGFTESLPDTTPPTVTSFTIENSNPDLANIVFSETVVFPDVTGLSLNGDFSDITLSNPTGSGSNWSVDLSRDAVNGESGSFVYGPTNNIEDTSGNGLVASSTVVTNNVAGSTILFEDDFSGDLSSWTEDLDGSSTVIAIDSGQLSFTSDGVTGTNPTLTSGSISSSTAWAQVDFISRLGDDEVNQYTGFWFSPNGSIVRFHVINDGSIRAKASDASFDVDTGLNYDDGPHTLGILIDGNTVSFWYWNDPSWVQVGTDQTITGNDNKYIVLRMSNSIADIFVQKWDNAYITTEKPTTQYPT